MRQMYNRKANDERPFRINLIPGVDINKYERVPMIHAAGSPMCDLPSNARCFLECQVGLARVA